MKQSLRLLSYGIVCLVGLACKPVATYQSQRSSRFETSRMSQEESDASVDRKVEAEKPAPQAEEMKKMEEKAPGTAVPTVEPRFFAYAASGNGQLHVLSFQAKTGFLKIEKTLNLGGKAPSFLAFDPTRGFLYAANEAPGSGGVMAFAVNRTNGDLSPLNEVPSNSDGPTHVGLDKAGKYLFAAHYNTGMLYVYPIQADGRIGNPLTQVAAGANAHQALLMPGASRLLVPCLGAQNLVSYPFQANDGSLGSPQRLAIANGAGPRHVAAHPKQSWVYLVNELNSTVQALSLSANTQELNLIGGQVSSLKSPVNGNKAAEIHVSADGRFVYSSNRGDDSIAQFGIATDGSLSLQNTFKTGGQTPRHFSIDPTGAWVLVANQDSGTITVLGVDANSGNLKPVSQSLSVPGVQFVEVIDLNQIAP